MATRGLDQHPGEWVAIDPDRDVVVAAALKLDGLLETLEAQGVHGATIQRAPAGGDPLFIGLG